MAGKVAFKESLIVRAVLSIPCVMFPIIGSSLMTRFCMTYNNKKNFKFVADMLIVLMSLQIGVTGALSVFNPIATLRLRQ